MRQVRSSFQIGWSPPTTSMIRSRVWPRPAKAGARGEGSGVSPVETGAEFPDPSPLTPDPCPLIPHPSSLISCPWPPPQGEHVVGIRLEALDGQALLLEEPVQLLQRVELEPVRAVRRADEVLATILEIDNVH